MNGSGEDHRLAPLWTGKLVMAVLVMAVLAVLSAGHAAVQVHAYFETGDSLEHWQARLDEADPSAPPDPSWGIDPPGRRVRDLESDLARTTERFFVSMACLVLFGGLAFLGGRVLLRARRR